MNRYYTKNMNNTTDIFKNSHVKLHSRMPLSSEDFMYTEDFTGTLTSRYVKS